ncbi:MAG TPA: DUF378 domain-containing protein [Caulobacteraceae bacterium]
MKIFNLVTLVLTILGGLDVGLMGLLHADVFANLFGAGTLLTRAAEVLVGLSAAYQIYPFVRAVQTDEIHAEVSHG